MEDFTAAWPALEQRIQEYHVASQHVLAAQKTLDRLKVTLRDMLDAWVIHQTDQLLAERWLHSQPFRQQGIVLPDELLP